MGEVKSNLVEAERTANAQKFSSRHFKKVAHVVMGEPNQAHKDLVKDKLLKTKQLKLDAAFKTKQAEKQRQKLQAKKQKEIEDRQKKFQEAKKKAIEDKRKAEE